MDNKKLNEMYEFLHELTDNEMRAFIDGLFNTKLINKNTINNIMFDKQTKRYKEIRDKVDNGKDKLTTKQLSILFDINFNDIYDIFGVDLNNSYNTQDYDFFFKDNHIYRYPNLFENNELITLLFNSLTVVNNYIKYNEGLSISKSLFYNKYKSSILKFLIKKGYLKYWRKETSRNENFVMLCFENKGVSYCFHQHHTKFYQNNLTIGNMIEPCEYVPEKNNLYSNMHIDIVNDYVNYIKYVYCRYCKFFRH